MKQLHKQLLKSYKMFEKHMLHPHSKFYYQKKVVDNKWAKYFINCVVYEWDKRDYTELDYDTFHFEAQFGRLGRAINISTCSWTNDPLEKRRKYPKLKEVEDMFENLWKAYWGEYYELYN